MSLTISAAEARSLTDIPRIVKIAVGKSLEAISKEIEIQANKGNSTAVCHLGAMAQLDGPSRVQVFQEVKRQLVEKGFQATYGLNDGHVTASWWPKSS